MCKGLVRDARGQLNTTSGNFNGIATENRGQLRQLLANTTRASNSIAGLTETLDFTLRAGGFRENSQAAFRSLIAAPPKTSPSPPTASASCRKTRPTPPTSSARSSRCANRPNRCAIPPPRCKGFVAGDGTGQIKGVLASLGTTANNLEVTTASINNIIADPAVQADIKGSADNLNQTLAATRASAERINALLGGKKRTKDRRGHRAGHGDRHGGRHDVRLAGRLAGAAQFERDAARRERAQLRRRAVRRRFAGRPVSHRPRQHRRRRQFHAAKRQYLNKNLAARYGLYRSKLGVGLEARRGKFFVEGNAYGLNDSSYNLYGGVAITRNLDLMAGTENIRGQGSASIAVRLRP